MDAVAGLADLKKTLEGIAGEGNKKVLRAAVGATMTVMAKAARQAVNASSASPEVKRAARTLIGKRFDRKGGEVRAKVGFAVGMKGKKKFRQAGMGKGVKKGHSGFVSAASIHLFVLGTQDRYTGGRMSRFAGRIRRAVGSHAANFTGRMKPELPGVIGRMLFAKDDALAAAAQKAREALPSLATSH
jgi:hypothetical protein